MTRRYCNAKNRGRPGYCQRRPVPGNVRCFLHGGRQHLWRRSPEGEARKEVARQAGFKIWLAKMHIAKELGIIDRFPAGKRKGAAPNVTPHIIAAAQRIVMTELEKLPAPVDKPFAEMSMGEKLAQNARDGLDFINEILHMPHMRTFTDEDGNEHEAIDKQIFSAKKDTALSIVSTQVRVDENALRRQTADKLPDILERLAQIQGGQSAPRAIEKPLEGEPPHLIVEFEDKA